MTYLHDKYDRPQRTFRVTSFVTEVAYTSLIVVMVSVVMVVILGGSSTTEIDRLKTENQRLKAHVRVLEADRDDALRMARQ